MNLDNVFTYHPATPEQLDKYKAIREQGKLFTQVILEHVPDCEDKQVAIRCIREAVAWANAAIALDGEI